MSISHTPGPWHVVPYGDGDSLVVCSDADGEWRICFMATHGGTESVWHAIQANANLIAAAPDLLKACSDWIDWLKPDSPWREDAADHEARMLDAMRAAISKATSRQPEGER